MTMLNVVGNKLLTLLARLLFNVQISDVCSGLWGYRGQAIRGLELSAEGFAIEVDMLAECHAQRVSYSGNPHQLPCTTRKSGQAVVCQRRVADRYVFD